MPENKVFGQGQEAVLSARLFNDCGSERNWRVL